MQRNEGNTMKRIFCLLLMLLMAAASAFATEEEWTFENSFYRWTVVNCDEWISLREHPSVSADVLKQIPLGAEVIWHDGASDGFVVVEYEGVTGFALHGYLQGYLNAVRVVNCDEWVSLREQPDADSERIRKVPLGQLLYSGGRIYIQYRKVERHFDKDAQNTLLCARCHQGLICGVFHLAAGIENKAFCGVFGSEYQGAVVKLLR